MIIKKIGTECKKNDCFEFYNNCCNLADCHRHPDDYGKTEYPTTCYCKTPLWIAEDYDGFIGELKDFVTCKDCGTPIGISDKQAENYGGKIDGCDFCKECFDSKVNEWRLAA